MSSLLHYICIHFGQFLICLHFSTSLFQTVEFLNIDVIAWISLMTVNESSFIQQISIKLQLVEPKVFEKT